ncbi:hypothetical protein FAES_4198 [Fibrella aestuarina BUZ 2]|uniref:DUF3823 domain-containing protein n=1 Tax=Fibrella aestuarina BUZ 2 TaxID=1166018 RepID=I0KDJ5_9BACT|nr:DUF3823 domain-containing protein [Fibrella aestuarina]CCH02198.1 hypothetical protein FAES_4198 [Fibrella aestuarina BUZ 2]
MKRLLFYGLVLLAGLAVTACDYDNYAAPQSYLKGRIVYKGEPIGVEYNNVTFELWEPGWQKRTPITVTVDQDGSYSALLFDATYKMYIPSAQGPFRTIRKDNSDTTTVALSGSQTMDIEVMPYYMIRNARLVSASRKVTGTASLEKIITDANARNVERVSLYVSKTQFVDGRTSVATKDLTGADLTNLANLSLSVDVPALTPAQSFAYARIGVKIAGVEDMLFSPVQKIQL